MYYSTNNNPITITVAYHIQCIIKNNLTIKKKNKMRLYT